MVWDGTIAEQAGEGLPPTQELREEREAEEPVVFSARTKLEECGRVN